MSEPNAIHCCTCKQPHVIPGRVRGDWQCQECCDREAEERHQRRRDRLVEIQQRHRDRKCLVHVPGKVLPADTSDEEAQRICDENLCCHWTRYEDKVICWGEM